MHGRGEQSSSRKMGVWMAAAMVVGNMVGSGVYLLPASLAPYGWNGVAAWVIATAGAVVLAYVIGCVVQALPHVNGPVGGVAAALGPLPGALIGWSAWVSYWTASATVAIAAVSYLSVFAPAIAAPGWNATVAVVLIVAITLLNLRGARAAGGFQLATTVLKMMPLIAVIFVFGWLAPQGKMPIAAFPPEGLQAASITSTVALTLWALVGFEAAGLCAEKIANPNVTVPRATLWGTAVTGVIYIMVCSGIVLTLPAATLAKSDTPFVLFLETYATHGAALAVAAFAAISAIGTLNGFTLVSGEVPLGLARDGMIGRWFGKTDARNTPARMLIVSSLLAILLVIANASKSTAAIFTFMALLSTSAVLWLYLAVALAALKLGITRMWATIGALYALWTLYGAGLEASGLSLILMLTGLPFYFKRSRGALAEQAA